MLRKNVIIQADGPRPILADLAITHGEAPCVVMVHGFKSYKDWGAKALEATAFLEAGFNVLKFNFSHNGGTLEDPIDFPDLEAFGRNTIGLELEDIGSVLDYVTSAYSKLGNTSPDIFLLGHSRGAATAMIASLSDDRIKGVISWNGVSDITARILSYDLATWRKEGVLFIRNGRTEQDMPLCLDLLEDIEARTAEYDIPKLIPSSDKAYLLIHAKNDTTVPYKDSEYLAGLSSNIELHLLDEGGHTLGTKHPWQQADLPAACLKAIDRTIAFIRASSSA